MSPGRAEAHAEDARSALTRRLARSYFRPDIAPSHRACAVHSRESTSVPSRLSSAAPPLSAEPTGLNPPTPVSGEPDLLSTLFGVRVLLSFVRLVVPGPDLLLRSLEAPFGRGVTRPAGILQAIHQGSELGFEFLVGLKAPHLRADPKPIL